jgi:hypothetical protein
MEYLFLTLSTDFYNVANQSLANGELLTTFLPARTQFIILTEGLSLTRYKPTNDLYTQDEIKFSDKFKLTVDSRALEFIFPGHSSENPAKFHMTL